jgi:glycosidase
MNPKLKIFSGNSGKINDNLPTFEFHIAKEIRKKYEFDDDLFSSNGNVILANFRNVRVFVQKLNAKRKPEEKVVPGQVNAAGLMDEIFHYFFRLYETQINKGVFKKALTHLENKLGEDKIRKVLFDFISVFPPLDVFKGKLGSFEYLNSFTEDRSNAEITIEEMILLYFANFNPANEKIIELFNDNYLAEKDLFKKVIGELDLFFQKEEKFGPDKQDIFTFFKLPILNNPDNIEAQLEYIKDKYGILLDENFIKRLLSSKDLIKEDYFLVMGGPGGAPTIVPKYKGGIDDADFLMLGKSGYQYAKDSYRDYEEFEKFTPDSNWMPRVVMIAKNTYVWLDQLSKKYQRPIKTLDQIPDEELDELARWNFNGLWLIGIWERSSASKKIKHIMGNIDAVSSAYSLYDYEIAHDLGGEYAYHNLNERSKARGIRLASDMVPNHTGIFSKWVIEHPEYFIQSQYPPFPGYSFTGPDLTDDWSVQLRIEDGYWSKSDAAVVFQRIDNRNGEIRYIYHGNDGTNMPWNDTAQLNMIKKEVREAVIQKIFDVARRFSIIRFDAAMTLAKKHFSRLWYPEPGRGGDIPSRADYSLTREEFDNLFPVEFWREVVDRINNEMPETLLLAEAFWLMEGYFVRTLGMHRVYNSAFMHMMMKEENSKYRDLISNTLEFEPEILKRYVNFMSNPDEETAIKQFGTDDKYFGVCTLMITLPGLPMFAHGQIEGFTEKYGMEYQRAYYHEVPNNWLVERHMREIFPLIKMRYLFSQVDNFWLFDFINDFGHVNENVFAYTNGEYGEYALVFYNNKYENTAGTILLSVSKLVNSGGGNKVLQSKSIADVLEIKHSSKNFYIFREHTSNLEFVRTGNDIAENGFKVELGAFKYLVYLDWREVYDETGDWSKLTWKLGNQGVPNMMQTFNELKFEAIHHNFERMFNDESLNAFIKTCVLEESNEEDVKEINSLNDKYYSLLSSIKNHYGLKIELEALVEKLEDEIVSVRKLNFLMEHEFDSEKNSFNKAVHNAVQISNGINYSENVMFFILWLIMFHMKELFPPIGSVNNKNCIESMFLDIPVKRILRRQGRGSSELFTEICLLNVLHNNIDLILEIFKLKIGSDKEENKIVINYKNLLALIDDSTTRMFLNVNEYQGAWYYSKEKFEELMNWIFTLSNMKAMNLGFIDKYGVENVIKYFKEAFKHLNDVVEISRNSEYKLETLIELLEDEKTAVN